MINKVIVPLLCGYSMADVARREYIQNPNCVHWGAAVDANVECTGADGGPTGNCTVRVVDDTFNCYDSLHAAPDTIKPNVHGYGGGPEDQARWELPCRDYAWNLTVNDVLYLCGELDPVNTPTMYYCSFDTGAPQCAVRGKGQSGGWPSLALCEETCK
jgi:hypothetical protein